MTRLRLLLLGALGLLLLLCAGAWGLSHLRPIHIIQHLQSLPPVMDTSKQPGVWYGSQRRSIALADGRFTGEVGVWWDRVPPPTVPNQLSGWGGSSGSIKSASLTLRTVPAVYDSAGVAKGSVCEWALPLWFPTLLVSAAITALLVPDLLLLLSLRSRRRRRLGLCLRCGYDRRGLAHAHAPPPPCPECGDLPAPAAASAPPVASTSV